MGGLCIKSRRIQIRDKGKEKPLLVLSLVFFEKKGFVVVF